MKPITKQLDAYRVPYGGYMGDSRNGCLHGVPLPSGPRCVIIFSNGGGWDHVSVSMPDRCPTWDEMAWIKQQFFYPEECVVQYHPPESTYKNVHPYCLHLWRWQHGDFPMPPIGFV